MNEKSLKNFYLYSSPDGEVRIETYFYEDTIWLTQKRLAMLFAVDISTINEHLKNIYNSNELSEEATIGNFPIVQNEGGREVQRELRFYNLDAIISVGYRVSSAKATQFRIWANSVLKEYIIKGFALDDGRLKQNKNLGKDYFRELLERVRSIRASERRIYQQITDIFAECSIDYDRSSEHCKIFYAMIQNKFHFAITGNTAAEIIYNNANAEKPFMGLTTWKNSPKGRILKTDTSIAKNYLQPEEIKKLERAITAYFDYIERLIENNTSFTMQQFADSVNKFLEFNEYKILNNKGSISHEEAENKAFSEYDKFNKKQKIDSDFDRFVKRVGDGK